MFFLFSDTIKNVLVEFKHGLGTHAMSLLGSLKLKVFISKLLASAIAIARLNLRLFILPIILKCEWNWTLGSQELR